MRFFFFNDTATTEIYTLSLHDALPISLGRNLQFFHPFGRVPHAAIPDRAWSASHQFDHFLRTVHVPGTKLEILFVQQDRKSTRLNSSHANISYAVFCLKKKKPLHSLHH